MANNTVSWRQVALEKPGTWVRYKKGLCDTCFAGCCMLFVEVTADDLIKMGLTDEFEVTHCHKDLVKRLKKEKIIKRYTQKTGKFTLTQQQDGSCLFLDNERNCTHYEDRPDVCRRHPEIAGPRVGFCPYTPK